MTIEMSETGAFFVFNEAGFPISGPYDTPEDARVNYPDAEILSHIREKDENETDSRIDILRATL